MTTPTKAEQFYDEKVRVKMEISSFAMQSVFGTVSRETYETKDAKAIWSEMAESDDYIESEHDHMDLEVVEYEIDVDNIASHYRNEEE